MPEDAKSPHGPWLELSEAAEFLGVHFTTLRRWTNAGKVPYIRTPGGRRRYAREDLERLLAGMHHQAAAPVLVPLEGRTLDVARQQLQAHSAGQQEMLAHFAEDQRARFRYSGQRLLGLLIQYGSRGENGEAFLEEARRLAGEYGSTCSQAGMSVTETVRTFLFFGHSMLEAVQEAGTLRGEYDAESRRLYHRLNEFMDAILLATIESYCRPALASTPQALEG